MITNNEKLRCAERELSYRRRVYPRWVELQRMTAQAAQREIAVMEAIRDDYQKLEPDLFKEESRHVARDP